MQAQLKNNIIYVPKRKMGLAPILLSGAAVLFLALGAFSVYFSGSRLTDSTETRRQAAVSQGNVVVTGSFADITATQNTATITLEANTNGVQVDGLQLLFNMVTNTTDGITVSVDQNSGLMPVYQEVEKTTDGFLVSFIAVPQTFGQTFSSTTARPAIRVTFQPTRAGSIQLSFDQSNSLSTIHGTNPPQDTLRTLPVFTFNTVGSITPSGTATPTPTPTPTPQVTPLTCNQTCTTNAQCGSNLRCYNGVCRLATNVDSTTCTNPPDRGLQRTCNDYCANTGECASGYTCFNNRCRLPENPDSQSCSATPNTITAAMAASCNTACSSNSQCAVNLRCYNGACRLATNPSSLSCAPATKRTVSTIYSGTTGQKGADTPTSTPQASPKTLASPTASPFTMAPSDEETEPTPAPAASALDEITRNLESRGISLPIAAIAIGVLLFVIALLSIASRTFKRQNTPPRVMPGTRPGAPAAERSIEQRISELKAKQGESISPTAGPTASTAQTPPPSRIQPRPVGQPMAQSPQVVTPAATPNNTMIERIKNKGVMEKAPGQK